MVNAQECKLIPGRADDMLDDVRLRVMWGGDGYWVFGVDEHTHEPRACLNPDGPLTAEPDVAELAAILDKCVVVTLEVDNVYELYEDVHMTFKRAPLPYPPSPDDEDAWEEWEIAAIIDSYTGTGCPDGDAWYDVEITESTVEWLVGRKFDAGY